MDKKEAIEFLKTKIDEISHLYELAPETGVEEYNMWFRTIQYVLEEVFGKNSSEYLDFTDAPKIYGFIESSQREYIQKVERSESALTSIIQKYDILGYQEESTPVAEPTEKNLRLQGSPDMILGCIQSAVATLNSDGYSYSYKKRSGAPDYSSVDRTHFVSYAFYQGSAEQIGAIHLQLLPQEKTLLKYIEPQGLSSAFGILLSRLLTGLRELGFVDSIENKPVVDPIPKAFIAHGGQTACLRRLCEFLDTLGVKPLVAEWSESEGRWTEDHVGRMVEDSDCYVILAEYGNIVDLKTGAKHPRLNVIDELGRSRQRHPSKVILLLEKDVSLPSNVSGIVYERFTKRSMEKAFVKVARELRAFGILKSVKA